MKKINVFNSILLSILLLTSCTTLKHTSDIGKKPVDKIGKVTEFKITWAWTDVDKNKYSDFTEDLLTKLEQKAIRRYGQNIELRNIKLEDKASLNAGIHAASTAAATGLAYCLNGNMNADDEDFNPVYGLFYIPCFGKIVLISADVIPADVPYERRGRFVSENEYYTIKDDYERIRDIKQEYDSLLNDSSYNTKTAEDLVNEYQFTDKEIEAIKEHKIFIGMSENALLKSWGKPEKINKSVGSWGVHKQYCYSGYQYVYVEDGFVTSWQQ